MGISHLEISIISTVKSAFIWQNDERNVDGRLLPGVSLCCVIKNGRWASGWVKFGRKERRSLSLVSRVNQAYQDTIDARRIIYEGRAS